MPKRLVSPHEEILLDWASSHKYEIRNRKWVWTDSGEGMNVYRRQIRVADELMAGYILYDLVVPRDINLRDYSDVFSYLGWGEQHRSLISWFFGEPLEPKKLKKASLRDLNARTKMAGTVFLEDNGVILRDEVTFENEGPETTPWEAICAQSTYILELAKGKQFTQDMDL
jgi:hypothetical protein